MTAPPPAPAPAAAAAALEAIRTVLRDVRTPGPRTADGEIIREQALASLLLLREVREQLAGWESGLIEAARRAGASWAELAAPLGVTSRQAAERRYLRLHPEHTGTGEQRVKAARDSRAANRSVTAWARAQAADLRTLAGQITALTDLPEEAGPALGELREALADNDAARLVNPLSRTRPHLREQHRALADRVDALTLHTDRLRRHSVDQRRGR